MYASSCLDCITTPCAKIVKCSTHICVILIYAHLSVSHYREDHGFVNHEHSPSGETNCRTSESVQKRIHLNVKLSQNYNSHRNITAWYHNFVEQKLHIVPPCIETIFIDCIGSPFTGMDILLQAWFSVGCNSSSTYAILFELIMVE